MSTKLNQVRVLTQRSSVNSFTALNCLTSSRVSKAVVWVIITIWWPMPTKKSFRISKTATSSLATWWIWRSLLSASGQTSVMDREESRLREVSSSMIKLHSSNRSSGLDASFKSSDKDCWEFCYSHLWILLHAWQVWQWHIRVPFTSIWAMGFVFPPDCHNKLASLKAMLVQSYDSLTQWLSGEKSR